MSDDHAWCLQSLECGHRDCFRNDWNIIEKRIPHSYMDCMAFSECELPKDKKKEISRNKEIN